MIVDAFDRSGVEVVEVGAAGEPWITVAGTPISISRFAADGQDSYER